MSFLSSAILGCIAKNPKVVPGRQLPDEYSRAAALSTLLRVDPLFSVRDLRVVDFGSGHGHQAAAFLELGAKHVLALEISQERLNDTRELCGRLGLAAKAEFQSQIKPEHLHSFDFVVSQDAMEHYPDPEQVLGEMRSLLRPGGRALVTFGPPWYSPYGAHTRYFLALPWAHLLFSERAMMKLRSRYRSDGSTRYADVDGGMNKMSLAKFERILAKSGFRILRTRYDVIKKAGLLAGIPVLRELFVNHVTVWLEYQG